eukprot:TRINITY_DN9005_c0_g1_i1.p1 TRINITY_DN9005_c0_g1~~TRINITY_DN9005_c0_g1_i1.p1  ORF type:complete len:134 (+),score=23.44 TRINITY_DN9005_c0_g1_i1:227-628(+)
MKYLYIIMKVMPSACWLAFARKQTTFLICSRAFKSVNQFADTRSNLFHLRDFVYFLRYLRKHGSKDAIYVDVTPDLLLKAIQRNFNGVSPESFDKIVGLFFDEVQKTQYNKVITIEDDQTENMEKTKERVQRY